MCLIIRLVSGIYWHGCFWLISALSWVAPQMLRVNYREGGHAFAPIVIKYWLRKLAAPLINWRPTRMFRQGDDGR